jgi:hypothetical protein
MQGNFPTFQASKVPLDLSPSHELPQVLKKGYVEALKVDTSPQATRVPILT